MEPFHGNHFRIMSELNRIRLHHSAYNDGSLENKTLPKRQYNNSVADEQSSKFTEMAVSFET